MLNKKGFYIVLITFFTLAFFGLILFINNGWNFSAENHEYLPSDELVEGRDLANTYCARCHSKPDPDLLPKRTWISETLPAMGPMLGIISHNGMAYDTTETPNQPKNYFPSEQLLSNEEWQKILNYYEYAAPEQLTPAKYEPQIITDSLYFHARTPHYPHQTAPIVTAGKFDPVNRQIFIADANKNSFMVFDENLNMKHEYLFDTPISDIQFFENRFKKGKKDLLLTYIGDLNPSDAPLGSVVEGWYDSETGQADLLSNVYKDSLTRPVESQLADLNGDGEKDLLINEFGRLTGRLSWVKNNGDLKGKRNVLIEVPGCIETHVLDLTNDDIEDVVALCTQLDQSIYLFKNNGNGRFDRERLLKFKITAGSSSFELHDFNNDGYLDILYTSGDNADFSKIYKPYHGVYIYLNDGKNKFTQEWFYPINGAYKAIANDFNKNGRLDIAVISYFPDVFRPEEGFIFFQNDGDLNFTPYHHPAAKIGRWITIDIADWNGNGYDDILLSNFSLGTLISHNPFRVDWTAGPYFLVLENHADTFIESPEQ